MHEVKAKLVDGTYQVKCPFCKQYASYHNSYERSFKFIECHSINIYGTTDGMGKCHCFENDYNPKERTFRPISHTPLDKLAERYDRSKSRV